MDELLYHNKSQVTCTFGITAESVACQRECGHVCLILWPVSLSLCLNLLSCIKELFKKTLFVYWSRMAYFHKLFLVLLFTQNLLCIGSNQWSCARLQYFCSLARSHPYD